MDLRAFSKACISHGFTRNGDKFFRLVGDGIFQMIYVGEKEYFLANHPLYSRTHRSERTVTVFLRSMYAAPEGNSIDDLLGHRLSVRELKGLYGDGPFDGSSAEYEWMCGEGFSVLDALRTQEALEAFLFRSMNPEPDEPYYSFQLYDLFLRCGYFYKARMAVLTLFSLNCFALASRSKSPEELLSEAKLETYRQHDLLTWPAHREAADKRLADNYARNLHRVRELGLDFQ